MVSDQNRSEPKNVKVEIPQIEMGAKEKELIMTHTGRYWRRLKEIFCGDGVVINIRTMTTDLTRDDGVHKESKQFGFIGFSNPKDAAEIILRYNNEDLEFNNKQIYVNYYEDKVARK